MDVEYMKLTVMILTPAIVAGVWLIRLEGRLNTHEAICSDRYQVLKDQHTEVSKKIDKLDEKLDALIDR